MINESWLRDTEHDPVENGTPKATKCQSKLANRNQKRSLWYVALAVMMKQAKLNPTFNIPSISKGHLETIIPSIKSNSSVLSSLKKLDSEDFVIKLHDVKKAEDNEDNLNKAVEEVELNLHAVKESKEQIKIHLDNPTFHPTLNSAITPGFALLLVLIGVLTKCRKKYRKQLDSDFS